MTPRAAASPRGVTWRDRTLVIAQTGGGKSTLLNHLMGGFRCQRLLVDTKGHEWTIPGVAPGSDVGAIDWSQPIVHYVDRTGAVGEYEELFAAACTRRNLVTVVHELADLCENNANRTPPAVKRYLKKGRSEGRGLLGGSQRPVEMPKAAMSEVQHVFLMVPPVLPDDLAMIAPLMGRESRELGEMLHELQETRGSHSYLWYDRRARELTVCPPLAVQARRQSLVRDRRVA